MEVLQSTIFAGPNRWSSVPTAELQLDAGRLRLDRVVADQKLRCGWEACLPHLRASANAAFRFQPHARPRVQQRLDQFAVILSRRASPGLVTAHATRALQLACGVDAGYVAARDTDEPDVELVAVEFEEVALLRGCVETALRWCHAAMEGQPIAAVAELRQLVDLADDVRLGPSSLAILRAAARQGIPFRRLGSGSLVQLGEGKRQRRIWTAETDATSAIAESIAQDKELTKRLLRRAGVPVPQGRPVTSPEDAWLAAEEIGVPVVVKPRKANHARGISLAVTTREEVERAYEKAIIDGDNTGVMVEQYARGQQHRLLVIGQRLVAASRGESEYVVGDGQHTIEQLVDIVNRDPRRGANYTDPLDVLKLDDSGLSELRRQGLAPESIPARGQRVLIQQVGDLTTDCTADVHPDNAAHAILAARIVGLDIAGMDVVAEDIGCPLEEQRGAILEVNAGPSIGIHAAPLHGQPQPVGEAVIELVFPHGADGRIPVIAVTGGADRGAVLEQVERFARRAGRRVGRAAAEGLWLDGRKIRGDGASDAEKIVALLGHPDVELAVWESHPDEAWANGLECERVDVAIVASLAEEVSETWLGGMRAVVHAVPSQGTVILPLELPCAAELAASCRGSVVYAARSLTPHRRGTLLAQGHRVVYVRDRAWVIARRDADDVIAWDELGPVSDPNSFATLAAIATWRMLS